MPFSDFEACSLGSAKSEEKDVCNPCEISFSEFRRTNVALLTVSTRNLF